MSPTLLFIVLVVGLLLLTLEIIALPGGIAGIAGIAMMAFGIWQCYELYGATAGHWALLCCIVACVLLLIVFMKSKTWNRFSLTDESDSKVNQLDETGIHVGSRGSTVARLAPTGKALIEGKLVEVHAINQFIDPNRPVEVVAIEGYRIDVRETDDGRFD
ncbi:MAG: hypothetical protein AUK63_256 [bacterium P3]|nr:MAG: hypothetical protein AUK63_256 [bacterium P3]KWW42282.1 MAG: hypothetical protein F083_186 [bacterium F083]